MTAVLVAVFSALGGVLAGLVPTLAVSERRRLLRFVRDEAATLREVEEAKDEEAAAHVRQALGASTARYRSLATQTRYQKAERQKRLFLPVELALGLAGCLALVAVPFTEGHNSDQFRVAASVSLILALSLEFVLRMRVMAASREATQFDEAVAEQRARAEAAEASIDEFDSTLREWESTYGEGDDPEVSHLLAALQRSVDAAKQARSSWAPTKMFYGGSVRDVDPYQMRLLAAEEEEELRRRAEEDGGQPPLI